MECQLLRIYTQFWRWDITEADSSYLVDTKDIRRANWSRLKLPSGHKGHSKRPGETSSWHPGHEPFCLLSCAVLWCVGLLLGEVCIYPDTDCVLTEDSCCSCSSLEVGFSSSPMRIHGCAAESNLALGTVVGKPNFWTKICNWAAVYVCSSWIAGLDGLWNCFMSSAIWKSEEWMSKLVLSMTIQARFTMTDGSTN